MAQTFGPRYHYRWRSHSGLVGTWSHSRMLDQIIGLILAILALVYLAYAMLRPERF